MVRSFAALVSVLSVWFLAACAGSGEIASVVIASHADGAVVTGSREVAITGTITGNAQAVSVEATLNGAPVEVDFDRSSFSARVTLADNDNELEVTAIGSDGVRRTARISLRYPFLAFENFQEASLVLGQENFSDRDSQLDGAHVDAPYSSALVHDGRLYLPDYWNNRVLVYEEMPAESGAAADYALGQPDLASGGAGSDPGMLYGPQSPRTDGSRFFLSDYENNRILIWNAPPASSSVPADVIVGQDDFGGTAGGCARDTVHHPESLFVVGGRLMVADTDNHRVLIWNEIPAENGADADLVLGQADFGSCSANGGTGVVGPGGFDYPSDVWSDGERLVVVDSENHRVLIWNSFPEANGQEADLVLGQADMTGNLDGMGREGLATPYFVTSNGNQIFVADEDNNRVLIWDSFPTTNGEPASRVLGQSDFDSSTFNDSDRDGMPDTAADDPTRVVAGPAVFHSPRGLHLFEESLIVTDGGNSRFLIFQVPR